MGTNEQVLPPRSTVKHLETQKSIALGASSLDQSSYVEYFSDGPLPKITQVLPEMSNCEEKIEQEFATNMLSVNGPNLRNSSVMT